MKLPWRWREIVQTGTSGIIVRLWLARRTKLILWRAPVELVAARPATTRRLAQRSGQCIDTAIQFFINPSQHSSALQLKGGNAEPD